MFRAVHAVVNSGEVDHLKPAPDIVQAAVDAAGAPARRAVMVGDAVYDLRAAREVGSHASPCSAAASAKPSCVRRPAAIYANCADLLTQLDTSPIGALLRS